jgi:phage/plasmid-like protein (TIGR03299 family)
MSHELEQININGEEVSSFAFTGKRVDIWHRLGQQYDGRLMTASEAMSLANMDRDVTTVPAPALTDEFGEPIHVADGLDMPHFVVLGGKPIITEDGQLGSIPTKIVGVTGSQGAVGHADLSILDRFLFAEEAIKASRGEAVWSTAGLLRDGRQGFATMEAPPVIIDPNGVNDIIRKYMTVTWAFDGSRSTELGVSDIRVVCANTLAMHDLSNKKAVIKVKHTSRAEDRLRLAAEHWAMAQDSASAIKIKAERLMAIRDGKQVLKAICDEILDLKHDPDASGRQNTLRANKRDEIYTLYHADTNLEAVGDNAWAAVNTVTEWLDWYSPVKGKDQEIAHLRAQFDGTYDSLKSDIYDLALASV